MTEAAGAPTATWLTPGVVGIGIASLLSDLGHEVPTSLLPSLVTSTLVAPASALGLFEGISDGLAGVARLGGGALSDDPARCRRVAVGGYASTAVLASLTGGAVAVWQVGIMGAGAWASRGLRVPARNALLADMVPAEWYGRAYGFERTMDNVGAIGGPLLAIGLVAGVGVRAAIGLSVIPGLLAAVAIVYAIARAPALVPRERQPIRLRLRPVLGDRLGRLLGGVSAFELGNVAATLLILRATQLLQAHRSHARAIELALGLYTLYNAAAAIASIPGGRLGDRIGATRVLAIGVSVFGLAYVGYAVGGRTVLALAPAFVAAGVAIGLVETAEHAAVAALSPRELRGSAFGALARIQAVGTLAASAVAGVIWTAVSPRAAFVYLTAWMLIALIGLLANFPSGATNDGRRGNPRI